METNLIYGVKDKPDFAKVLVFALQQLLAILAATILVPALIGHDMSQAAALFGAGVGTIVYLLFTRFKSPVFLGSSFAFIPSMSAAFIGGVTVGVGYLGMIIGAVLAGLVYVIIALVIKVCGSGWVKKLMPPVVIGPTVSIIGLGLAGNAVANIFGEANPLGSYEWSTFLFASLVCGLITLFTVIVCSVFGKKMMKMIPFIIGIVAGYIAATIITLIGYKACGNADLQLINFELFKDVTKGESWYPALTFIKAFGAFGDFGKNGCPDFLPYLGTIAVAYVPVAFVVFAEHIADHKNLSSIIGSDLLEEPGLDNTLLGDGVGSMVGAFFGGCPNTTYGESIGCVAISRNASVVTILATAILCIICSFFAPFTILLKTIPTCVMGGVCFTLYGFIAVSGLKMLQPVDLNDNKNLFVASVIFIAGIGGFVLTFTNGNNQVKLSAVACALILGILTNVICSIKSSNSEAVEQNEENTEVEEKDEYDF